jgi:hypothetical protein
MKKSFHTWPDHQHREKLQASSWEAYTSIAAKLLVVPHHQYPKTLAWISRHFLTHDHEAEEHNQTSRLETSYSSSHSFKLILENLQKLKKKLPQKAAKLRRIELSFEPRVFFRYSKRRSRRSTGRRGGDAGSESPNAATATSPSVRVGDTPKEGDRGSHGSSQ